MEVYIFWGYIANFVGKKTELRANGNPEKCVYYKYHKNTMPVHEILVLIPYV